MLMPGDHIHRERLRGVERIRLLAGKRTGGQALGGHAVTMSGGRGDVSADESIEVCWRGRMRRCIWRSEVGGIRWWFLGRDGVAIVSWVFMAFKSSARGAQALRGIWGRPTEVSNGEGPTLTSDDPDLGLLITRVKNDFVPSCADELL